MKKFKGIIFLVLTFLTSVVFSQTTPVSSSKEQTKQSVKKNQEKKAIGLEQTVSAPSKQIQTTGPGYQLDENDPYQGRTQEFLSLLTVKELPSDFPKYKKNLGVGGYNALLDEFLATHKDIVIESVKRKLESQGK
jgi:Zn-dependent metalloprotease